MKNYLRMQSRAEIFIFAMAIGLTTCFLLSGCSTKEVERKESSRYIAVVCKNSQHEFWRTVEQGAMDAGEELGLKVTFEAPEDESQIDAQIDLMKKAIDNKADAIVLAPLDTERLNPIIEEAAEKDIPVLTLDSDVTSEVREATIGTNNINAGAIAARNAAEMMGRKGKLAIVGHVEGAQTTIERYQGFVDAIEENYKDIEIVGVKYSGGDSATAKEQAEEFLQEYPDITCFYGTNEGAAVGIGQAIEEMGKKDSISVMGFDSSDAEIQYLKDGVIDAMMVQNPYNMGYLGVRNINKVLDGRKIEERIETGATYVDQENLDDEDTQWLLYPLGKEKE